jgi:hypothetical protein
MRTSDLTLVFQGAFRPYVTRDGEHALRNLRRTRQALPGACVILSTWEDAEVPRDLPVDVVVRSADPGPLAPLKLHDGKVNNVNRQLVSTLAGMAAVSTPYAAKLRTDCWLEHAGFLDFHAEQRGRDGGRERERILACSFFTLDPTVFERLPFHLSDWFQFGPIDALRRYWSAPPMDQGDGRHHELHPHAPGATYFERQFRARFAVEQHYCRHYAQGLGYGVPAYLNDANETVLAEFRRFLASEVMLLDPWQIGLVCPRYGWVGGSLFQSMANLMHLDWLALNPDYLGTGPEADRLRAAIAARQRRKRIARVGFHHSRPLHDFLFDPRGRGAPLRRAANRVLRMV